MQVLRNSNMSIFSKEYTQGYFVPKHPEKCVNLHPENSRYGIAKDMKPSSTCTYRSSWELKFMKFCDKYDSVLEWGSEVLELPYVNEVDGKAHRYVTDFYFVCREKTGNIARYILEVKPKCQIATLNENGEIIYPDPPKTKTQSALRHWQERCDTLRMNNSKWKYARKWCGDHGYIFKVLSEEEIGIYQ